MSDQVERLMVLAAQATRHGAPLPREIVTEIEAAIEGDWQDQLPNAFDVTLFCAARLVVQRPHFQEAIDLFAGMRALILKEREPVDLPTADGGTKIWYKEGQMA